MIRRGLLTAMALMLLFASACADDYGKAVVFVKESSKLHLRAEPSSQAQSLGLFFTGTQVECLSALPDEWVKVRIGAQSGYMKGEYLRPQSDAEWIISKQPMGYIAASKTVNLRSGPSASYSQIGYVAPGRTVRILGETLNHWYYVRFEGECGYISAKLVDLLYDAKQSTSVSSVWKQAYRTWIRDHHLEGYAYDLISVNGDDVPELAVDTGAEAGGCLVLVYDYGTLDVLQTRRRGFSYIRKGNLLCNSDGHMDVYYDDIYAIEDGKWTLIAGGEYSGYNGGWSEERQRYICKDYVWNGQKVSMEAYLQAFAQAYREDDASTPTFEYDRVAMLEMLQ